MAAADLPEPAPVPALVGSAALPAVPVEAFQREVETAADFALSALAPATRRRRAVPTSRLASRD